MPGRAGYFCAASSDTSSKKIDRSRSGVACATRPWRLLREMNDSPNRKGNNPKSQPQLGVTGVSGTRIRDTKREQLGDEREKLSWEHIDQEQIYKPISPQRTLSEVTVGTENKQPGSGSNEEKRGAGIP
ncbi:hypothetical protein ACO22_02724 [Paracoccidioides brasiliensis]|uniref:Uncharacterized protein n=1 Tax=Paracoccidioides brasiliensis TaxID=121759 RepID=A0A1D2JHY6_PARBR|nr:hypothetical protein ACO22_02724 [Paracoccidioides brasiliensis]